MAKKTMTIKTREGGTTVVVKPKPVKENRDKKKERSNA